MAKRCWPFAHRWKDMLDSAGTLDDGSLLAHWVTVCERCGKTRTHLSVHFEPRDLWVGVYLGPAAVYICLLPTLVVRWGRKGR